MLQDVAITSAPLDLDGLVRVVTSAPFDVAQGSPERSRGATPGSDGAVVTFLGLVRDHNQGRRVHHLVYESYDALALRALARIVDESRERWPDVRVAVHHRVGRLEIGEASVAIVAASAHRADGFAACRYAIERVKQIVPIWKHEFFEGGDVWIEGATADPEDLAAREAALRVACA